MADLSPLRPTDNTPAAIAAAIVRCGIAGRGALAEIDRLKLERAGLLLTGKQSQLDRNLGELTRAMADATVIGELLDQLQRKGRAGSPAPSAEQAALEAASTLAEWWAQHSAVVIGGAQLLIAAFTSVAKAAAAAAPTSNSNVAPFPRPPGAA